jgi:hypothetical protein
MVSQTRALLLAAHEEVIAMKMRIAWCALAGLALLGACEKQGPLERAGEEADEAIENLRNNGETLGNRIDDAIDNARERAEEAADETRDEIDELRR